jgi:hypothetical protein
MSNKKMPSLGLIVKAEVTIKEKATDKTVCECKTDYKKDKLKIDEGVDLKECKDCVGMVKVDVKKVGD